MKKKFAMTENVKNFALLVNGIINAPMGIDRMALVYGESGLGKTETALWWMNNYGRNCALIRIKNLMTGRWLLSEIVNELGVSPAWRTMDLFNQAVEALIGSDRVVIVDEVDHLTHDSQALETLRDIHDTTNSPFVFIGMSDADKKLKRYKHLWRRFSQVLRFKPLSRSDVASVLNQICETQTDDSTIDLIFEDKSLTVATLYRWAQLIDSIGKNRKIEVVSADDLSNQGGKKIYVAKSN